MRIPALIVALAVLPFAPAIAQEEMPAAEAPCPATPPTLPAELAGWQGRTPLAAAGHAEADAALTPGKGVDLKLLPTPEVHYALRPQRPGGSVSYGGMARFTVAEAGTYRIAIGSAAWIDLVKDGTALESIAHGHGPACSGIRKMVDFALEPGDYILEIAGNGAPMLPVLVARVP